MISRPERRWPAFTSMLVPKATAKYLLSSIKVGLVHATNAFLDHQHSAAARLVCLGGNRRPGNRVHRPHRMVDGSGFRLYGPVVLSVVCTAEDGIRYRVRPVWLRLAPAV